MTKIDPEKLLILHHSPKIVVVQTMAGSFDKFGDGDLYGEFNLGLHVGDDATKVLKNRAKLLSWLQEFGDISSIHWLNQIHSDIAVDIDAHANWQAASADALMTCQSGRALAIMTADCVPIAIFGDGDDAPISCIHAGWQGLTNGIIAKTVAKMREIQPNSTLFAVIGAHISQDSYEIDAALADKIILKVCELKLTKLNQDELYHAIIKNSKNIGKCLINLNILTKLQLNNLGIQTLYDDAPCTYQDSRFYSYRAQTHAKKPATGRMAMVVAKLP